MDEQRSSSLYQAQGVIGDWRCYNVVGILGEPSGMDADGERPIIGAATLLGTIEDADGGILEYQKFSAPALSLSIAMRAEQQATVLRSGIRPQTKDASRPERRTISREQTGMLFDFFEQCMVSSAYSFHALEAFCNLGISTIMDASPSQCWTPTHWMERRIGGKVQRVLWTARMIERAASTDEKLGRILPELIGMPSPKGGEVWHAYNRLKEARDAIVHLRYADQHANRTEAGDADAQSVFSHFLTGRMPALPKFALEVMLYFCERTGIPRWLEYPLDYYGLTPKNRPPMKPGKVTLAPI